MENLIKEAAGARVRQRLGLSEREAIPEAIRSLVEAAARDVTENAVEIAVIRDVEDAAADYLAHGSALPRVSAVAMRSDLLLLRDATNLAARRKALEGAGFSREEAMRILVAEISAGERLYAST